MSASRCLSCHCVFWDNLGPYCPSCRKERRCPVCGASFVAGARPNNVCSLSCLLAAHSLSIPIVRRRPRKLPPPPPHCLGCGAVIPKSRGRFYCDSCAKDPARRACHQVAAASNPDPITPDPITLEDVMPNTRGAGAFVFCRVCGSVFRRDRAHRSTCPACAARVCQVCGASIANKPLGARACSKACAHKLIAKVGEPRHCRACGEAFVARAHNQTLCPQCEFALRGKEK